LWSSNFYFLYFGKRFRTFVIQILAFSMKHMNIIYYFPKNICLLLLLVLLFPVLEAQTVKVGVYQNSPKVFVDEHQNAQGIFIDIIEDIAEKEEWQIEYVIGTWAELLEKLKTGEIDILPDVAYTASRDSLFVFNKIPVIQSWVQVYTRPDMNLMRVEDLQGLKVAVLAGSVQEDFLLNELFQVFEVEVEILSYNDYEETVSALLTKQVDAILASRFFYFSKLRTEGIVPTPIIHVTGDLYFVTGRNSNSVHLLDVIDGHMSEMKNDPGSVFYKSLQKWLDRENDHVISHVLIWLLVLSGVVIFMIIVFMFILRMRIKDKTRELLEAGRKIEENERNYREIFNTTRDGIYVHDLNTGEIIDVNDTVLRMFGCENKEDVVMASADMSSDVSAGFTHAEAMQKVTEAREKGHVNFEWKARRNNGEVFWVEVTLKRTSISGVERILAFVNDIDIRKKREKEAAQATALFHTLAENSPVGIFRTDSEGNTTYVNPSWSRMTGVDRSEAFGIGWSRIMHEDDRERVFKEWLDRVKQRVESRAEYRLVSAKGDVVWVLGYAVPEFVDGEFRGYVGTMTDVTLLKEAEIEIHRKNEELIIAKEKAEESDRLKSSFLANLSHEIRTPMNAISGFASLLVQNGEGNDTVTKYSSIIHQSTEQLLSIINDIIEISLIETQQMKLRFEELELCGFFNHLETVFQAQMPENKDIQLVFHIPPELCNHVMLTDKVKFEQIMSNLIGNALKYTENGRIIVECKEEGHGQLMFSVTDTGIGIPEQDKKHVFERFYRCENEQTTGMKGSGLGLAISKAYVEMLGGKITLKSQAGKGSCFYFTHPLGAHHPQMSNEEKETPIIERAKQNHKVLLVDDENLNILFLESALAEYNFQLLETSRASEAVEICRKNNDILMVLMDVKLEDGSGIDATKIIKQEFPNLPVIMQTAYALPEDELKAKEAGCDEFLAKPISLKKLRAIVDTYLSLHR
jgi:PAS domain S-box-containing protein